MVKAYAVDKQTKRRVHKVEATRILPKASIIRMLLNSHDLNSIITKSFDAWQYIISKVGICVDFWLLDFKVDNIGRIRKEN